MIAAIGERLNSFRSRRATLRHQLLLSLLAPIVLVTLISSVVSYYFSFNFATLAYDYSLFDSALDLSRQVRLRDGQLRLDLPSAALDMLESDKHDRIYHMVNDAKGRLIAGHDGLPLPPGDAVTGKPVYYDGHYRGDPVRIAALYATIPNAPEHNPILVQVAETLNKRHILANEILLGMLLPELLLIVLVGLLVWFGVERGLRPLSALQREIGSRSHRDLSPLPEHNAPEEVRALVRAMNELLARLSEGLAAQQRFITDAAHQLRTPLAGLKTQTELALRQDEPADVRRTLQQLSNATGQTTHLVNQLLLLARAEPGSAREQAVDVIDLNTLARETTTEWVPHALARHVDLGFEAARRPALVEGEALLVKEMLRNLLDNAVRYTQSGGQVTVRVAADDEEVTLRVEDNGRGIPQSERERVFERFYRVLGTGVEGCGLGLAIVREIAQSHNAQVRLDPGVNGGGTLAAVIFPPAK